MSILETAKQVVEATVKKWDAIYGSHTREQMGEFLDSAEDFEFAEMQQLRAFLSRISKEQD